MNGILPIVLQLAAVDVRSAVRRSKRKVVLYSFAGLLLVSAYALALVAAVIWIGRTEGLVAAALVVAAGLIAAAIMLFAASAVLDRQDRKRVREKTASTALLATTAIAALPLLARSKLMGAFAIAGIAAYLLTRPTGEESQDNN
jgi:MFS family permease